MRLLPLVALALAACAPRSAARPAPRDARAAFVRLADSLLDAPEFRNAHWGVLVVDPRRGDTLYARNAAKLFLPASNQKLVTGAVALARLGPGFRFRTALHAAGPVRDGVLAGDLVVTGTGDPSFSDAMRDGDALAPLRTLADSLRARGIRAVDGALVAGPAAFPDTIYGYGWAFDDLDFPYSAGVDDLFLNEGSSTVTLRVEEGEVRAAVRPAIPYPDVHTRQVRIVEPGAGRTRLDWVGEVAPPGGRGVLTVRGTLVRGDSAVRAVAHREPARAFLAGLARALRDGGVEVRTGTQWTPRRDTTGLALVAEHHSPRLAEILPHFERPSQNQIGELLFKTIGRVVTGVGSADSARRAVERQLAAWGVDSAGFAVRDGSGLSRHDYLSPAAIVRVLDRMRVHDAYPYFFDALPTAGVDGTLATRMRGTPAQGNLRGKTGTLDKARSLSGYVTTADGHLLLFAILCNNFTVPVARVTAVQDRLGAALAALALGR